METHDGYEGWLTSAQVAAAVGRTPHTVRQLAAAGRFGDLAASVETPWGSMYLYHPSLADRATYEGLLLPKGRPKGDSPPETNETH